MAEEVAHDPALEVADAVAAARPSAEPAHAAAPLGVIAGAGALPRLVAEARRRAGAPVFVIALRGFVGDWISAYPHSVCGVGQVGKLFGALKAAGCRNVCFAGGLARPSYWGLRFDFTALVVAAKVARLMRRGDDAMLRGLAEMFEARGFHLVPAQSLLADQLAPAGVIGARAPSALDLEDVARAAEIVDALGRVDVGQGAVVARGRCLRVETVQGTDAMLQSLNGDRRRAGAPIPSGALYKAPKPGQDRRMDLPAIGPDTIRAAKAAGLSGVAVEAGSVFLLDIVETAATADREGLFLFGRQPAEDAA